MSSAAKSVFVWGIYMLFMGTTSMVIPNVVLPLLGFPPTDEVWVRGMGMLSFALGYFYINAARHEIVDLFRWKVQMHIFGVLCMVAFVVFKLGPPMLLLLATADLLAAIWTGLALRAPALPAAEHA